MNKYVKKIRNTLIMFLAIIIISIIACMFIGCGEKKNDDSNNEIEKVCYGKIIRYDVVACNAYRRREIVVKTECNDRICFITLDRQLTENNKDQIFKSCVGDTVSIVYKEVNDIVNYTIIKEDS